MYDFLLIVSAVVFAATVAFYVRQPAASAVHPATFYLAFHGFVFVLRPLVARWYDFQFVYKVYHFQPSISDKITVILGSSLAMLVFVAVTLKLTRRAAAATDPGEAHMMRRALAPPILLTAALLTPLATAAQIDLWRQRANGFDSMVRDLATGAQINTQGVGWFYDSALLLAPIAVMLVWLSRYRWWGWACFATFAVLQSGTGIRGPLIYAAIGVAALYVLENHKRWFQWQPVLLLLCAGIAFNFVVTDRGAIVRDAFDQRTQRPVTGVEELAPLEHMDFANLEYFEYIVYAVPQRTGSWDYFANNLQIFTEPVPRVLWKNKPIGSPVQFFSLWDYGTPIGMTISLPGAGWMSLGYVGIVVQAALFAMFFGLVFNGLVVRRNGTIARIGYALTIAMSLTVFRDGTLLTLARITPFYLGPLLLVMAFARFWGVAQTYPHRLANHSAKSEFLAQSPAERRQALAVQATQDKRRS